MIILPLTQRLPPIYPIFPPTDLTPQDPQAQAFLICKCLLMIYVMFRLLLPAAISLSTTIWIYTHREGSSGTFGIIRIAGMVTATVVAYIILIKISKFISPHSDQNFLIRALLTSLQYMAIGMTSAIIGFVCSLNAIESDWGKIFGEGIVFVFSIFFINIVFELLLSATIAIAEHFKFI